MKDEQSATNEKAIQQLKTLANHNPVCLFTTMLEQLPLSTRPMFVRKVCDKGNFWFLSSIDSKKNIELAVDERVQLFFLNTASAEFASIYGKATIFTDKEKIRELWHQSAKMWFIEGIDDPTLSVIKVQPLDTDYWDSKRGKMGSLLKVVTTIVDFDSAGNGDSKKLMTT
jgi:general stress protein 26